MSASLNESFDVPSSDVEQAEDNSKHEQNMAVEDSVDVQPEEKPTNCRPKPPAKFESSEASVSAES